MFLNIFILDHQLGESLDILRESVCTFAAREIATRAAAIDRDYEFLADLWRNLGAMGLLGITVEENYGGLGLGYVNDSPTGRSLRDAKLYEIGAGTSEIRRWLIGRELFEETQ